jgi:hypothetical protein
LLLIANVGSLSRDDTDRGYLGIAFYEGTTPIGVGAAASSRTRIGASNMARNDASGRANASGAAITFLHSPGTTASRTYTVRALQMGGAGVIFINRIRIDTNETFYGRAASTFTLMEVKG